LRNPKDHRNDMLTAFIRLVRELQPRWFLMESVPGLTHKNNRELLREIFKTLESIKGYKVSGDVLLAADYGVPQLRYRLFIVGTNTGSPIRFPSATHTPTPGPDSNRTSSRYATVKDAIHDLADRSPEQYDPKTLPKDIRKPNETLLSNHYCPDISGLNKRRIKKIAPGEDWRFMPIRLLPERYFATRASDQKGAYGRLIWDWPAYTITNSCSNITAGTFTHPNFDRGLSVREAARLQSFADDHVFYGSVGSQYQQVGNAVPPLLAQAVAEGILLCNYRRRKAKNWGHEGRLNYKCIDDAISGKIAFPKLTRRHVHPSFDRRRNKSNPNPKEISPSLEVAKSTWDLRRRPIDPKPEQTQRLRKLAEEPNNYRATKRARAIVQFLDGEAKELIISQANVSEDSVKKWIDGYFVDGLDGWRAYHTSIEALQLNDPELSLRIKKAIVRARRTLLSPSKKNGKAESNDPLRLHMNSYLVKLIGRFRNYSVAGLIARVEKKLKTLLGTVYVGDLLAIADVALRPITSLTASEKSTRANILRSSKRKKLSRGDHKKDSRSSGRQRGSIPAAVPQLSRLAA
jgi:DNA (cytosine-5)-methyltransferase 1